MSLISRQDDELTLGRKILELNWGLVLLLAMVASVGVSMLFSVADGNLDPWAQKHAIRFGAGLAIMVTIALIDIRFWLLMAYPAYLGGLVLLLGVEFFGASGGGAERWLVLGPIRIQPSEFVKIAMVLVLARYFRKIPFANRLCLAMATAAEPQAPVMEDSPVRRIQAGDRGVVESMCRPVGKVRFGDDLVDAVSEGGPIDAGTPVRVLAMDSNRPIVERDQEA